MSVDVGITLRVTSIALPPAAQPGAHEEHPSTKVDCYVGSKEGFEEQGKETKKTRKF
jgi:hypothetical protein